LENIEDEEERKEAEKLLKRHNSAKTIIASKVKGEEPKEEPKKTFQRTTSQDPKNFQEPTKDVIPKLKPVETVSKVDRPKSGEIKKEQPKPVETPTKVDRPKSGEIKKKEEPKHVETPTRVDRPKSGEIKKEEIKSQPYRSPSLKLLNEISEEVLKDIESEEEKNEVGRSLKRVPSGPISKNIDEKAEKNPELWGEPKKKKQLEKMNQLSMRILKKTMFCGMKRNNQNQLQNQLTFVNLQMLDLVLQTLFPNLNQLF